MKVISYQCVSISSFIGGVLKALLIELWERESHEKNKNKENVFLFGGERDVKRKRHGGVSLLLKWDLVGGGLFGI